MSYRILENIGVEIKNIDGAIFNRFIASSMDGIIPGVYSECSIYRVNSTNIQVGKGLLLIQGFRVYIEDAETIYIGVSAGSVKRYLIGKLTLTTDQKLGFSIRVDTSDRQQRDNLFRGTSGVYEVILGEFTTDFNGIIPESVQRTLGFLRVTVPVLQTLGASTDSTMSQKAITQSIENAINNALDNLSASYASKGYVDATVRESEDSLRHAISDDLDDLRIGLEGHMQGIVDDLRDETKNTYASKSDLDTYATLSEVVEIGNKVIDLDQRVDTLEGMLIEYREQDYNAYEAQVPDRAAPGASIDYIGGKTIRIRDENARNLLDPTAFGFPVDELGRVLFTGDSNASAKITLRGPAQLHTVSCEGLYLWMDDVEGVSSPQEKITFEVVEAEEEVTIFLENTTGEHLESFPVSVMLNEGSIALPYEPYENAFAPTKVTEVLSLSPEGFPQDSYTIPTEIYEKESYGHGLPGHSNEMNFGVKAILKKVKELVLTGEENWEQMSGSGSNSYFRQYLGDTGYVVDDVCLCNKFESIALSSSNVLVGIRVYNSTNEGAYLAIRPYNVSGMTVDTFKAYLAQQHTLGNPVKVLYALTVPEHVDVSGSLVDYDQYKPIQVYKGGKIRLVNEKSEAVPSGFTYLVPTGG